MRSKINDTYGCQSGLELSLEKLFNIMYDKGATSIYVKKLAPNDNSKNQIYLGGDFSSLNIIPVSTWESFVPSSAKSTLKPATKLIRGSVHFQWVDCDGFLYEAPDTKLILYPQYPEVRLSGFLRNSGINASQWMDVAKSGRSQGRYLVIAIHPNRYCIGFLAVPGSRITEELNLNKEVLASKSVFIQISMGSKNSKNILLDELKRIHIESPILGKKLDSKSGKSSPYKALNGAGYTLEAELGIFPNGCSAPDFMGWEVKAHSGSVVTLMTPEPSGGFYKSKGIESFIKKYGYLDKNGVPNRLNFGGIHKVNVKNDSTKLIMQCSGFKSGESLDLDGGILLLDQSGNAAAEWSFKKLLEHWNRKHAKAVYVPYKLNGDTVQTSYLYGNWVDLGIGTDFLKFLNSITTGKVYYDPGIKLEGLNTAKPIIKRRSQFRISYKNLTGLYDSWERESLLE